MVEIKKLFDMYRIRFVEVDGYKKYVLPVIWTD